MMKKTGRGIGGRIRVGVLLLFGGIILRRPFVCIMQFLPHFFDYAFFVYPGKESDMDGYVPRSFANRKWGRTQIFFGGIITSPRDKSVGRGILIGAPSTVRSMVRSHDECKILEQRMRRIAEFFSIKKIAIAGRAPTIFLRHGIKLDTPFVHGEMGMVFCTIETLYTVIQKHGLSLKCVNIVVFGAGRVGKSITNFLSQEGCVVTNIWSYSVFDKDNDRIEDNVIDVVRNATIIIVISAKGSDFYPYMKYVKNGGIIISETHPPMQRPFTRGSTYRAALSLNGMYFMPSLETYDTKSVPGCVVEAIVSAQYGEITDQRLFNIRAREIGFCAHNVV